MQTITRYPFVTSLLFLTACVTINVYFPAAAAESAADRIIEEVYGKDGAMIEEGETGVEDSQSALPLERENFLVRFFQSIIPAAHAQQPDIDISTPGINKLRSLMKQRHAKLRPYYANGAVGMENNGLIGVRNAKAVPLKDRNNVKKLVADENRDRSQLYREIASANGHPEWEADIRRTFARRWIALAPGGWYYQDQNGSWQQK